MSQRHRSLEAAPPPKMDLRAHAHNERHRINSELHAVASQVSAGYEPDDCPRTRAGMGAAAPSRCRARPRRRRGKAGKRHWKMKMWKRRTTVRRAKAQAIRLAGE